MSLEYQRSLEEYNQRMSKWYQEQRGLGRLSNKYQYTPYKITPNMSRAQLNTLYQHMKAGHDRYMGQGGAYEHARQIEQQQQAAKKKKGMSWWKKALIIGGAVGGAMFIPGAQALLGKAFGALGKGAGKLFGLKGGAKAGAKGIASGFKAPASAAKLGWNSALPTGATHGMSLPGITAGGKALPHLSNLARGGLFSKALTGHATKFAGGGGLWGKIGRGLTSDLGQKMVGRALGFGGGGGGGGRTGFGGFGGFGGAQNFGSARDGERWSPRTALDFYAGSKLPNPAQSVSMFSSGVLAPRSRAPSALTGFGAGGVGAWAHVGTPGGYGQPWRGFLGGRTFAPWV